MFNILLNKLSALGKKSIYLEFLTRITCLHLQEFGDGMEDLTSLKSVMTSGQTRSLYRDDSSIPRSQSLYNVQILHSIL